MKIYEWFREQVRVYREARLKIYEEDAAALRQKSYGNTSYAAYYTRQAEDLELKAAILRDKLRSPHV